jgi:hypothetical protein
MLVGLLLAGSTTSATAAPSTSGAAASTTPAGERGIGPKRTKPLGGSLLLDHGGPVLASSTLYPIYWGDPAAFPSDLGGAMDALLGGLNGSSYLGIAQQYLRGASISTNEGRPRTDASAPPRHGPSTAEIGAEVAKLVQQPDPNGIYLVFTSNYPHVNYCAWHNVTSANGVTFQVAYIPNNALAPGCSPYTVSNLHANSYSQGTVADADSTAHELMEAITDPHINAWYEQNGAEIADKCEYNYQGIVTLANLTTWQIQSEWSNALGGCQQQ